MSEKVEDISGMKEEEVVAVTVEDEETGEKIPDNPNYWFSRILKQHPEILSLKERGRPLGGMPETSSGKMTCVIPHSYGKDYQNAASTETSEAVPPAAVMQLILQYLHEEGLTQTRDMLLNEAKELLPELLDAMCYQPSEVPPVPPLGVQSTPVPPPDDAADGAPEEEKRAAFTDKTLDPMYQKALLPLLQLGAGKADVSDLFSVVVEGAGEKGVAGDAGDSSVEKGVAGGVAGSGGVEKGAEEDQEVEAVEEYTSEITFDEDEDEEGQEAKDENVWDEKAREGENVIDTRNVFVAGTLNQMVSWLTEPMNQERSYMLSFLLTYPLVVTGDKLMAKLIQRYNMPQGLQESEQEKCILALKVIKVWIERYPGDITGGVHDLLSYFLRVTAEKKNTTKQFGELYTTFAGLDELKARRAAAYAMTEVDVPVTDCEPSVVPRNIFSPKLSLDDIDEAELARQLYIMDYVLFWRIQPRELIGRAWALHPERAPNVTRMLARMHRFARWVQLCILQGYWSDAGAASPDRVRMLARFLSLATALIKNMDFFSAWAIYIAVTSKSIAPVHKLAFASRRDFSQDATKQLGTLKSLFTIAGNYTNYRNSLRKHPQRSIPAIVIHLGDLALVDESIPTIVRGNLINYQKLAFTARLITSLFPHRDSYFKYQYIDQIAALLRDVDADVKVIQQLVESGFKS